MTGQIRNLLGVLLLAAASGSGFYGSLLERGIEQVHRGEYARAVQALRIAAFGFVDDVPNYQTAQIYLAVASEKLGNHDEAKIATKKAIRAEAIAPTYRALRLPAAIRAEFDKMAGPFAPPAPAAPIRVAATPSAPAAPIKVAAAQPAPKPLKATPKITAPTPQQRPVTPAPQAVRAPQPTAAPTPAPAPNVAPTPMSAIAAAAKHQPSQAPILGTDITPQLDAAQGLLNEGRILAAREAYLRLAGVPSLTRAQLLALAKGLNDTSAWRESSALYARVAPLQKGEEPHMFAEAVNRYELGDRAAAKWFLDRALPALPKTREIQLYRGKIEGQGHP